MHTYLYTVLAQIMARVFFLSSNFSPLPLNETDDYTRSAFIIWNSESRLFGWWILIVVGDTCVPDPLDTVHNKMDSVVCSHQVHKYVWSPVLGEQLVLKKEPAGQSTWWIHSGSGKELSDSGPHSIRKKLFIDHMVF